MFKQPKHIQQLIDVVNTGNVPADFSIGGALRPGQARAFFDLVIKQDAFTQKVSTITSNKLTVPVSVLNITSRQSTRVAEGTALTYASNAADISNLGHDMTLLARQLYVPIPFGTIEDNADNPQFESVIQNMIRKAWANDMLDLATNGTDDDFTGSAFLELNEGWIQLLKDYITTNTTNKTPGDVDTQTHSDIEESFAAMLSAHTSRFKTRKCEFIVSQSDFDTYRRGIGSLDGAAAYLVDGNATNYLGYKVTVNPYMPTGTYIFGDPKDLCIGLNLGVKRYRDVNVLARTIDYVFDIKDDFEIVRPEALTIAYDQS